MLIGSVACVAGITAVLFLIDHWILCEAQAEQTWGANAESLPLVHFAVIF